MLIPECPGALQGWRDWHCCRSPAGNAQSACGVEFTVKAPWEMDGGSCQGCVVRNELLPMGRRLFPSGKSQQRVINHWAGQLCVSCDGVWVQNSVDVPWSLHWMCHGASTPGQLGILVLLPGCATGTAMALESTGHHSCSWPAYMFVHANLTAAFQVQISRENKRQSRNWSAGGH